MQPLALQAISLALTQELSVDVVLQRIVQGLVQEAGVALARVWLHGPGDQCSTCPLRSECSDQTRCLHLAASAGAPRAPGEDWTGTQGSFRRFPLGVRKIGRIGATGQALLVKDIAQDSSWIARPEWAQREGIVSFAGQPLVFRGEILGVLAIFGRQTITDDQAAWLRMFADHAAVALANSRAFEEIERLRAQLERDNAYLREEVSSEFGPIIGRSPALAKVLQQVELVAATGATVLLQGESGVGKELVARAIHERSLRVSRPMIRVNCGAVPGELFESEFFGHVKGAFTGALRERAGRFELADGGTLFLDEISEIPLALQSKLLRVLQEGTFERVGEERTRKVDVRVVAATNRDLRAEVEAGRFRGDLFYRLSVFPIEVPPLRERLEDVPALVTHFVALACERFHLPRPRFTTDDLESLRRHDWPGNVRELQNVVERAVITAKGGRMRMDPAGTAAKHPETRAAGTPCLEERILDETARKARDRASIEAALAKANGRIYGPVGAASLLGVRPTTLYSRLRALGMKRQPNPATPD
jgi:transcriptional regulator with GAF, ATPase, and Fis domain